MDARKFSLLSAILMASAAGAFGQTPPANDDFAHRAVLTGSSITFAGTLTAASLETQETNSSFPGWIRSGGSVWWTWTAPASSTVVIEIVPAPSAAMTNASLDVYSGADLNALTLLDANTLAAPAGRYVAFGATIGTPYQFRVAGGSGSAGPGGPFTLKLTATNPPVFLIQPGDCAVSPCGSAFFSAMAAGLRSADPFRATTRYQWSFNGVPIPDRTAPSLVVPGVTTDQVGSYSVIASNAGGITQGGTAMLTLIETNPVPRLAVFSPINPTLFSFGLTGEAGRWYRIESSPDLQNWLNPAWLQITNASNSLSFARLAPTHFVRASLNTPTDLCLAQLKQMLWGQYLAAIEQRLSPSAAIYLQDIKPYIPLGINNNIIPCPEFGFYNTGASILENPTCSNSSRGHALPPP